ncbi:UDP-N-acetylmuramoyl-tripeptide--D-alanyl-D-alanine ligase [Pseudidiomarina piscicola]|uniref:UDP-N-acetylmuramoyl-tripeptide--D-alanyl-D-alanine ligase n=1 Tax=Pseudidiomarina piscicola TaxID=2614830 RepID=A0A6S6WN70_9GAMM|nr:UDP-N-acetylmuramoyl-tripeptide--D-alanyl-D-alanine ligase [Pseudidiomarina piscicola]CAB0150988.1 UDP-N-acetylmuramoyl-tripeptide--D-alanyl-D-alanine ligase [Pseudidiomarina piscicola]VZT40499.1 UDP-N-acetylmuramoyl-tripeptide--D-alanyl-D-alanine ligase [Pseudomonas aeruginosa]
MIKTDMQWICRAVDGQLFGENCSIDAVSTDTRELPAGCLFIALQGQNFDAHEFAVDAVRKGAKALLVERHVKLPDAQQVPQIVVKDSRHALGQLGAAVKASVQPKTIAITGSSGKTTVKEMLAAILATQGNVLATAGNFNNDIGVPLTLLRLEPSHDLAIIELGANHLGEIAYTTSLTQPDVAIINNVAPAHVEGFGSVHGVFRAKSEIFKGLNADGLALTPAQSEFAPCWAKQISHCRHLTFGQSAQAAIRATDVSINEQGCARFTVHLGDELNGSSQSAKIELNLPGLHNVDNALVAIAAAVEVGCPLADAQAALSALAAVPGRMQVLPLSPAIKLIDDSYNANVGSVKAALDMLAVYPGWRMMVLGDMGELGEQARHYHEEVGAYAIQAGIDNLYTLGVLSQSASDVFNGRGGKHFSAQEPLIEAVIKAAKEASVPLTILVKGSRSAHMERVISALQARATELHPSLSKEGKQAC